MDGWTEIAGGKLRRDMRVRMRRRETTGWSMTKLSVPTTTYIVVIVLVLVFVLACTLFNPPPSLLVHSRTVQNIEKRQILELTGWLAGCIGAQLISVYPGDTKSTLELGHLCVHKRQTNKESKVVGLVSVCVYSKLIQCLYHGWLLLL